MKTHLKKLAIQSAFAACALSASATDYYWVGTDTGVTANSPSSATNWSSTLDGTGAGVAWASSVSNNIYLSNIATVAKPGIAWGTGNLTAGALSNERSATAVSWDLYGGGTSSTWNFASINQASASSLALRKTQSSAELYVNVSGNITNSQGVLRLGNETDRQQLSKLTVGGTTTLTGGSTTFVVTRDGADFNDAITQTNASLTFKNNLTAGYVSDSQLIKVKSLTSTITSAGSLAIGQTTMTTPKPDGTGSIVVYSSADTSQRIRNFSAGDLSITRTNGDTAANIGNLNVKANLFTGATGTFTYNGGTTENTTYRIRLLVQNADIDNFIAGDASGANNTYVEITRGQDITDGSALGTFKIGNLTTLANLADFRLGYMNITAAGYTSFTKYDTIDIGTANIAKGAVFVADKINIDALTKLSASNGISIGVGTNGVGATSVVLGADSNSVTNNYGGAITAYTQNLTINGTLNIAASTAGQAASFTKADSKDLSGTVLVGDVDIENLNFDTTYASGTANFNTNIANNNIDAVTYKGAQAANLNFGGTTTAHIGTVTVNRWVNSSSEDQASVSNYLTFNSAADIDTVNVNSGIAATASDVTRNKLFIQGNNNAATTLHIDTVNSARCSEINFGTSGNKFGNVTIDTINLNGATATTPDSDRTLYFYLLDGATVNITDFNVNANAGVGRFWSNADATIGTLDIDSDSTGAYTMATGKTLTINTINKNAGSTHRIGGDTDRVSQVNITTLNNSASTMNIYTVENETSATANVTTLNMLNSGATTSFFQNSYIGTLNFGATGTGGTVTNTGATTIGAINVAASGSISYLDMNATVTGNIDIAAGSALYLAKSTDGYTVTTAGLTATSTNNQTRITTSKNVTLAFNGTGTYSFTGRIHDFSGTSTTAPTVGVAEISLVKNGTGTQILRGENYYRGSTTVNEGTLYMSALKTTNLLGLGIGAVVLNGGKFGAISQASNVGEINATTLTWSNAAQLDFDIASASSFDKIILSGDFLKGTGTGDYVFNFTFEGGTVIADTQFDILTWDGTTDFSDTDSFVANFTGSENYDAVFSVTDGVLSVTFSAIPEPAQFAALFGLAALLFAIRRRRK